jgi:hypothetical protein
VSGRSDLTCETQSALTSAPTPSAGCCCVSGSESPSVNAHMDDLIVCKNLCCVYDHVATACDLVARTTLATRCGWVYGRACLMT